MTFIIPKIEKIDKIEIGKNTDTDIGIFPLFPKEEKKNIKTNWYKFVKSSPGKANAFMIVTLKSLHLKFDQI